jgi:hypothetical protein
MTGGAHDRARRGGAWGCGGGRLARRTCLDRIHRGQGEGNCGRGGEAEVGAGGLGGPEFWGGGGGSRREGGWGWGVRDDGAESSLFGRALFFLLPLPSWLITLWRFV